MSQHPRVAQVILDYFYMDDIPASTESKEESKKVTQLIEKILGEKGFVIKEWILSGSWGAEAIPMGNELSETQQNKERILGIQWNPSRDIF